jgi:ribosome maturation factor RimP
MGDHLSVRSHADDGSKSAWRSALRAVAGGVVRDLVRPVREALPRATLDLLRLVPDLAGDGVGKELGDGRVGLVADAAELGKVLGLAALGEERQRELHVGHRLAARLRDVVRPLQCELVAARIARRLNHRTLRVSSDMRRLRRQGSLELVARARTAAAVTRAVRLEQLGLRVAVQGAQGVVELVQFKLFARAVVREGERPVLQVLVQLGADGAGAVRLPQRLSKRSQRVIQLVMTKLERRAHREWRARRLAFGTRHIGRSRCALGHGASGRRGSGEERAKAEHEDHDCRERGRADRRDSVLQAFGSPPR